MPLSTAKTRGSSVWGSVPKNISTPSPVNDLKKVLPLYDELLPLLSSNLLAGLQGQIPTDVGRAVMDAANARAFASGVGGSGFAGNVGLRDLGLTSKQIQDQAFNQFLNFTMGQKNTATLDPRLRTDINQYNSMLDAAPNPTAQANFLLDQEAKRRAAATAGSAVPSSMSGGGIPSGGMPNFGPSWTTPVKLGVQPLAAGYSGTFGPSGGWSAPVFPTPAPAPSNQSQWNSMGPVKASARDLFSYNLGNGTGIPYSPPQSFRNSFESGINPFESMSTTQVPMQGAAPYQTPSFSAPASFNATSSSQAPWMGDNFFQESIFGAESSPSGVLKSAGINIEDYITPF